MSLKYQTILVAVDGSSQSELALQKAFKIASADEAKLVIAYVIDNRTTAIMDHYDQSIVQMAEQYGRDLLGKYQKEAAEAGIENIEVTLSYGSPKVKIPQDIAVSCNADLIIAGATGINSVERLFIGSVSENIARRANCDVMIVRNQ